ncbi:MAG: hypothetical protein NT053_09080 [Cyanobacteria bacterium]|nr:hypothetical protein [Cyanobacteriota bacterium]
MKEKILVPSSDAQERIEFLLEQEYAIKQSVERLVRSINEYRTRLVADVVTGKLDVREAATRLPDEELLPDLAVSDDEPDDLPIEEEDDA